MANNTLKAELKQLLDRTSLPSVMKASHVWEWHMLDTRPRRKSWLGRDGRLLRNIVARAYMLDGKDYGLYHSNARARGRG